MVTSLISSSVVSARQLPSMRARWFQLGKNHATCQTQFYSHHGQTVCTGHPQWCTFQKSAKGILLKVCSPFSYSDSGTPSPIFRNGLRDGEPTSHSLSDRQQCFICRGPPSQAVFRHLILDIVGRLQALGEFTAYLFLRMATQGPMWKKSLIEMPTAFHCTSSLKMKNIVFAVDILTNRRATFQNNSQFSPFQRMP